MSEVSIVWDKYAKRTSIIWAQNHATWQALVLAVLVMGVCCIISDGLMAGISGAGNGSLLYD